MKLFHPGLRELLNLNQYLKNHKMGFLTIETPLPQLFKAINRRIPYKIGLQLRREYRHIAMGLESLKLQDVDSIYVMEIYNQHLLFLLPLLRLTNKPIFLGLHGNQTLAQEHWLKSLGFKLLKSYLASSPQSKAILLELNDDFCDAKYQLPPQSKLVIPHPIISEVEPRLKLGERLVTDYKFRIGIVGIVREDKPINNLLNKVINYAQKYSHCQVILGTPKKQIPSWVKKLDITILDTTKNSDYFNTLKSLDILVTYYDKNRYFYRASGVISDAGSCGCYIIAPDYPLIQNQITWPVSIGQTFSHLDEIEDLLNQAFEHIQTYGQDNQWLWRNKRNAQYIAQIFNNFL